MSKVRSMFPGVEGQPVAVRIAEIMDTPALRALRTVQEHQRLVRDLGGVDALREARRIRATMRSLGVDRPATLFAPSTVAAEPPAAAAEPATAPAASPAAALIDATAPEQAKAKAKAAAVARGDALRAMKPREQLAHVANLQRAGRALAKVAGDLGMKATELRALLDDAGARVKRVKPRRPKA